MQQKKNEKNYFLCVLNLDFLQFFLSVCPDDASNWHVKVQSVEHCKFKKCNSVEEIDTHLKDFDQVRMDFPGLSTFNFENIVDLTISGTIGWDVENGCHKKEGGIFGFVDVLFAPVEEQQNNTLHAHFLIWIKDWKKLIELLHKQNLFSDNFQSFASSLQPSFNVLVHKS